MFHLFKKKRKPAEARHTSVFEKQDQILMQAALLQLNTKGLESFGLANLQGSLVSVKVIAQIKYLLCISYIL